MTKKTKEIEEITYKVIENMTQNAWKAQHHDYYPPGLIREEFTRMSMQIAELNAEVAFLRRKMQENDEMIWHYISEIERQIRC